jgi:taurine transport system permease protein
LGSRRRLPPLFFSVSSVVGILAVWELLSRLLHSAVLLPSPLAVAHAAIDLALGASFQGVSLWDDIGISAFRVFAGYLFGLVIGMLLGLAMALNRTLKALIDPLIEGLRPVPPLAWIPLLVIWFGIGEFPKVLLIVVTTVPIVSIATMGAVLGVQKDMPMSARCLGASGTQVMFHVVLPAALPGILTGARIATAAGWSSIVAVEMIASERGLGWLIWQAGSYLETTVVFVGMICIAFIALSVDRILRMIEVKLVPWKGRV